MKLVVALLVLAAALLVVPVGPVSAFEELDPEVDGISCSYFSPHELPRSTTAGTMQLEYRCFINAPAGADDSAFIKQWVVDRVISESTTFFGIVRVPNNVTHAAGIKAGSAAWGNLSVNGTGYSASNSTLPDGYLTWTAETTGVLGTAEYSELTPQFPGSSTDWWFSNNAMACDAEGGSGVAVTSRVAGLPCYDGLDEGGDVWPASWPGQSSAAQPCTGASFTLSEDGVDLEPPLQGQTGVRGRVYQLTIELPTDGEDDVWEMQFWPTVTANVGRLNLPDFTVPASGTGVRRFDVTAAFMALLEPEFDLGEVRVRCSNEVGVTYWTGETDSVAGNPVVQEPGVDPDDEASLGACFTLDGMSLTNPVTWVTGIGRMFVCLFEYMVVPDVNVVASSWASLSSTVTDSTPISWAYESYELSTDATGGLTAGIVAGHGSCLTLFPDPAAVFDEVDPVALADRQVCPAQLVEPGEPLDQWPVFREWAGVLLWVLFALTVARIVWSAAAGVPTAPEPQQMSLF